MKRLILSLLGAGSLLAQTTPPVTSASLDESEVRITYGELKRLVAATLPQERPPEPKAVLPVPAALLSTAYEFDASTRLITAEMQMENFDGAWHAIPIAGGASGATSVEPKEARLVIQDSHLCLVTDKAGAQMVRLTFAPGEDGQESVLHLAPAPLAVLAVKNLPEGKVLQVRHGSSVRTLASAASLSLPAAGGEVGLRLEDARKTLASLTGAVRDEALIAKATYTTQVVRDGSALTEGTLTVSHDQPVKLVLRLPADSRLLQCNVNGEAVRPILGTAGHVEVPLDDPATDGAESEVIVSFTATMAALQAAEGEFDLVLPRTPLFARQIDWNVQLPPIYDLGFSGNVDAITDKTTTPGLHLRKSLCRDQQPQARITYRKRTSN